MNRALQILNLLGVLALAVLCAFQWQTNRHANLQVIELENTRLNQVQQLAEKDKTLKGYIADLDDFRARLEKSDDALKQLQEKLNVAAAQRDQLTAERDALKTQIDTLKVSLDKWIAAVAARDQALKESDAQLQKLATDRNQTVQMFNDLAAQYNTAQDQLKQAADTMQKLTADRNEAVARFNDLANKYNALVKAQTVPATRP